MGKYINPFTDYGFKKIFGQELTKDLLIDFLNDLLEGERVITDLTFLNNEQLPFLTDALRTMTVFALRMPWGKDDFLLGRRLNLAKIRFFIRLTLSLYSQFRRQSKLSNTPIPDSINRKGYFQSSYRQVQ